MKDSQTPGESNLFYDFEALAATLKSVELVFLHDPGRSIVTGRIDAVFVRDGIEMLRMHSGLEIPLANILQVDSKTIVGFA